jgi:hypothetical protein
MATYLNHLQETPAIPVPKLYVHNPNTVDVGEAPGVTFKNSLRDAGV